MDYESYDSPFSWRYGRSPLRALYSEKMRRRLWRAVWVALAEAQSIHGLIEEAELADLRAHAGEIDVEAAIEIEREIHHDLMAEIRVFAQQARHAQVDAQTWHEPPPENTAYDDENEARAATVSLLATR